MNKRALLKVFLLCVLFCQLVNKAQAQYAIAGEAPEKLKKSIYWLTWNPGQYGMTTASGSTITDIKNGEYFWEYSPMVRIYAKISSLNSTGGTTVNQVDAYTPGGWIGDGLNYLYQGSASGPVTGVPNSALRTDNSALVTFDIDIKLQMKNLDGSYRNIDYPGIVIGDAEAIAYPNFANREYFGAHTTNTIKWQILNLRVDPNKPVSGQKHYMMDISNGGLDFEILADDPAGHDAGIQAVMFAKGATKLTNVHMKGEGATAISIGFVIPFDLGDATHDINNPVSSYGKAEHYINSFQETNYFPTDMVQSVYDYVYDGQATPQRLSLLIPESKLFMGPQGGANNVDPDGDNALNANATSDNINGEIADPDDENSLTPAALSHLNIKVNQNQDITVTIPEVKNNEAGIPDVYLYGWIDFDGDGKFSLNERATRQTLTGSTTYTNAPLVFDKTKFLPIIKSGTTFARFRVTKDDLDLQDDGNTTLDEASFTSVSDGEVEDYQITITGATISGKVFQDNNGAAVIGDLDQTTPISSADTQLYAYLVNTGTGFIEKKATVTVATGEYSLTADQNGSYNMVISTINLALVPGTQMTTDITAPSQLPATWQASVDAYGVNNPLVSGIEAGTVGVANLQVPVTVSSANNGAGITGVNFGINKAPVANDVAVSTNSNVPVVITLPGTPHTTDADGTVVTNSVTIEDINNGNTYSTTTVTTAYGKYELEVSTGKVTFTPANTFKGLVTQAVHYKIVDNFGTISNAGALNITVNLGGKDDDYSTSINTMYRDYAVKGNDGAAAVGSVVQLPSLTTLQGGTLVLNGNLITYAPPNNFTGTDTYKYKLFDGVNTSADINVTITVKPTGQPDADVTTINQLKTTNVLTGTGADAPGTNPGGATTITDIVKATNAASVVLSVTAGSIDYTSASGFVGIDTYTYRLTSFDGIKSDPITVTISVYPKGADDTDLTPVNVPVTTTVVANDGYDDGNPAAINIQTPPTSGTIDEVTGTTIKYTPSQPGVTTYKYTITQNGLTSAPITVSVNAYTASMTLTKKAENGYSTVGEKIYYSLTLKNTGTVPLTNVEITDDKADPLSISQPLIPTLAVGDTKTITAYHTTVAADVTAGKFENQAVAKGKDPKGNDVIKTSDDPTTTSTPDDPTVVPITPTPVTNASINLAKTGAFAGNQINYTFIITNNGSATLNTITLTDTNLGLNGISITAPAGGLVPNQSLTYNATYTLTQADKDLGAVNNTATVNAKDPGNNTVTGTGSTVTTVTKSPVATNDVAETASGVPEIISVLTNDDAKGSTFNLTSIEILSNPMHGTVVTNANGTVTYTPTTGYTGTDSFTYRVKDAFGYYTNTATVTVTTNLVVELKIPTLFSPNGDGVNDGFVIKDLGDYAQNELIVINRWGNEVYRQANYQNSWSGTGLNEGTYFYIVRLKKSNGESWVIRKGYVTLIRTFKK